MMKSVVGIFDELDKARLAGGSLNGASVYSEIYDNCTFGPSEHEGGADQYFRLLVGEEGDLHANPHFNAFEAGAFLLVADAETEEEVERALIALQQAGATNVEVIERREAFKANVLNVIQSNW